ncbi:MAG: archaemetzincin family Zn-dependent metalloprotease [Bacteroidales bacterium]
MDNQSIKLISLGYFERAMLEQVAEAIGQEFRINVATRAQHIDLSSFFDSSRRQYDANLLLRYIETHYADDQVKTLGLVSVDLFIPILTYIFGQAFLNGRSGIASHYRLGNERYGLPPDPLLLTKRYIKEVIHELGHCFGLIHCHTTGCVMQSSTYVEDIDQKKSSFCKKCARELNLTP